MGADPRLRLSAIVQTVVRKEAIVRLLGDDRPKTLTVAAGLGAASSSCSYAAVALARALFRKGAHFTAAMAFEIASTNLVIELGILLTLLMGWQFTAAEFIGGPIMIVIVAVLFRLALRQRLLRDAKAQADKGIAGSMEGHAGMDMSVGGTGTWWSRLRTPRGFTAVSDIYVMASAAIWRDLAAVLLIAGALAAWVPASFWQSFFLTDHPTASAIWGPLIGPLVAVVSFVCSIGRGAVERRDQLRRRRQLHLRRPGHPADHQHLPEVLRLAHRPDHHRRLHIAMVATGYAVELLFGATGLTPTERNAKVVEAGISWNYTTWLNLIFLAATAMLAVRSCGPAGQRC